MPKLADELDASFVQYLFNGIPSAIHRTLQRHRSNRGEIQTLSRGVCRLVEYTKETAEMYMTV